MTGDDLRLWRTANNYTQGSLAHELGVTRQTVVTWEKSHKVPRLVELALRGVPAIQKVAGVRMSAAEQKRQRERLEEGDKE